MPSAVLLTDRAKRGCLALLMSRDPKKIENTPPSDTEGASKERIGALESPEIRVPNGIKVVKHESRRMAGEMGCRGEQVPG